MDIENQFSQQESNFKYYPYGSLAITLIYSFLYFGGVIFDNSVSFQDTSPSLDLPFYFGIFDMKNCKDIRYQVWRLESYSFAHLNFSHYFFNFLVFIIYSCIIESIHGLKIIIIYFYGIFIGALSFSYFKQYEHVIGSSGGLHAILGLYLSSQLINFRKYNNNINILFLINISLIFLVSIIDYIFLFDEGTGYEVHLFGFISGHLLSIIIIKPIKKYKYHEILKFYAHFFNSVMLIIFIYNYIELPNIDNKKYRIHIINISYLIHDTRV